MTGFFGRLFARKPAKPVIDQEQLLAFREWYASQTKAAIALIPDEGKPIGMRGSRLGGPAWLSDGEAWPLDSRGAPLDHLAQLDMADCRALDGYPVDGVLQFFIGRGDLFGMNLEDLRKGDFLVRHVPADSSGELHAAPSMTVPAGECPEDYSPLGDDYRRAGLPLRAEAFTDRMDASTCEVDERLTALFERFDADAVWPILEADEFERRVDHHTGGYPAYTQSDIRYQDSYADCDQVLLRITSDDGIMWGDSGEAVFLISPENFAKRDFSKVVYSWDCC